MSDTVVRVEHLGKKYQLSHFERGSTTLRSQLSQQALRFSRQVLQLNRTRNPKPEEFWALSDVSFEINRGDRVGIIGRNGAGKSTLLKILSRITEPTTGRIAIKGRVASLLEVGTGFHPELTGRENIYLNGAILGMSKFEIRKKFDEIVDFAEVEKFLDTPVKRYSSGMYVRLAFAVAAHLEPEILIVDEVLAVGDAAFQKKCLGKMENVAAQQGRTVLFVSHNMGAVTQLCSKSILLQQGKLTKSGASKAVVESYLAYLSTPNTNLELDNVPERSGDRRLKFVAVYLENAAGDRINQPISGEPIYIVLELVSCLDLTYVQIMFTIFNNMGIAVTHCNVDSSGQRFHIPKGKAQVTCQIAKLPLPLGQYRIAVAASDDFGKLDSIPTACVFDVETSNFFSKSYTPPIQYSTALVEHSWQLTKDEL